MKLEPRIFERMGQYLKETLLRSSKSENDDEEHHQIIETLRNNQNEEVEPMMKRIWKILEKYI